MNNIGYKEFLQAIFPNPKLAHVTAFPEDPNSAPPSVWKGHALLDFELRGGNQYVCISTFTESEHLPSIRRKENHVATVMVVADDVGDATKTQMQAMQHFPEPSYILETSPGSEQWGWLLDEPCTDRSVIEALVTRMADLGMTDPGVKGVNRYVRMPGSMNTKLKHRLMHGDVSVFLKSWRPQLRYTVSALMQCIGAVAKADQEAVGLVDAYPPLLNAVHVKQHKAAGVYDITCPWVDEHTNKDDSGTAVFVLETGQLGFRCHHGHCTKREGKDLVQWVKQHNPQAYKAHEVFVKQLSVGLVEKELDALKDYSDLSPVLSRLSTVDTLAKKDAIKAVQARTGVGAVDLRQQLKTQETDKAATANQTLFDEYVYVAEQDAFYDTLSNSFLNVSAFDRLYCDLMKTPSTVALSSREGSRKVQRIDFAPGKDTLFRDNGRLVYNSWTPLVEDFDPGDISPWLEVFKMLGWEEHIKRVSQWLAFTLRYPEKKINHGLLLGGAEGTGKDFLIYPAMQAMSTNARYVDGSNLSKDFNEYLLNTKLLVVNETETGDYKDAKEVARDLKPLLAAPPMTLEVNIKHIRPVLIRNILNVVMTSNSLLPVQSHDSRRLFPIWSDFKPRDASGRPYEDVQKFWSRYWPWMKATGWRHVAYHLLHEVDLSDFDAGEPPPVTAFLQEIQHYSMTNWEELVVTSFRESEAFKNRTVFTSKEIVDTAALYAGEHQMSVKLPGNKLIARYLRTCPEFIAIRTRGSMIWTRNNLEGRILATKGHIRAHEVLLAEMSAQED